MSGANETIGLIRLWYDALRRGDEATCRSLLAPECQWDLSPGFPHGGTYRGAAAVVAEFFARLPDTFESIHAEVDHLLAEGETVVALGAYAFRLRGTDDDRRTPFAHVFRVRGDRVIGCQQIVDGTAFLR